MSPKDFCTKLYPDAVNDKGFHPGIVLTQAALESGWGEHAPGNMYFGVKDTDGINGNEQKIFTIEVSRFGNLTPASLGLIDIVKIVPFTNENGIKYFRYYGHAWFRKYASPKESFDDHLKFFLSNGRYAKACTVRNNPILFFQEIANAGYATDPNYAKDLIETYQHGISPFIPS